jgi:hypothetical protein
MIRLFLVLALLPFAALAGDVTITWTLPAEREDGTALSVGEIDHYELYADGSKFGDLAGGDNETFTGTTTPGLHCFAMKTADTGGRLSAFSNEVCKLVTSDSAPNTVTIKVEIAP